MNKHQVSLYKKALYGLKAFDPIEIKGLGEEEKRSIIYENNRTWRILNEWKQELATRFIERTFFRLFPKAPKTSTLDILIKQIKPDIGFKIDLSFKDIGITDHDIAHKLVLTGVLPQNFELMR